MEESSIGLDQLFVADHETTEVTDPRERPLDDPASTVASQLPAILVRGVGVTGLSRNDRFDPASHEPLPQRVGVVPAVGDQPIGVFSRPTRPVRPSHRKKISGRKLGTHPCLLFGMVTRAQPGAGARPLKSPHGLVSIVSAAAQLCVSFHCTRAPTALRRACNICIICIHFPGNSNL